ncbi:MAG: hypothetical protein WC488_02495 [Candidatus Micrarchaeia archaeon]
MDFGKMIGLAVMPIVVLVVLGTLSAIAGSIPLLNVIACVFMPLYLIIQLGVLIWAGHSAAKSGLDMAGAAITGAIVAGVASLVNGIIALLINVVAGMLGMGITVATGTDPTGQLGGMLGGGLVAVLCIPGAAIIAAVIGAVLAAIGALIAGTKK